MKYLCKIRYVGTDFSGYQVQPYVRTVQGTLTAAAEKLFGGPVAVTGCSRTDSGVHAEAFYLTLRPKDGSPVIPPERLPLAMQSLLPPDLSLMAATIVPEEFHARHDVKRKTYRYDFRMATVPDPFLYQRSFWVKQKLNITAMQKAAECFVGKKDFAAFMAEGSEVLSTVRTVFASTVTAENENVHFWVTGDGFLYNMVRIMAGTLLDVGAGRLGVTDIPGIIASRNRVLAGQTAPAHGLYLVAVDYGYDFGF